MWYVIHIDAEGKLGAPELVEKWADIAASLSNAERAPESATAAEGAVASWGGTAGGPALTFSIQAMDPTEAVEAGLQVFESAFTDLGLGPARISRLELRTEELQERWLSEPSPQYAGLAELAGILGVSKQRVYELRSRPDFPKPIAELAATPVWNRESLNHFLASWERKPGRPARHMPAPAS